MRPLSAATIPSRIDWKAPRVARPMRLMAAWYPPSIPARPLRRVQEGTLDDRLLEVSSRRRGDSVPANNPPESGPCLPRSIDAAAPVVPEGERRIQADTQPSCCLPSEVRRLLSDPDLFLGSLSPVSWLPGEDDGLCLRCLEADGIALPPQAGGGWTTSLTLFPSATQVTSTKVPPLCSTWLSTASWISAM